MRRRLNRALAIAGALLMLFLLFAHAQPAKADCAGNVLPNAGFEGGFSTREAIQLVVANSWTPFWQDGPFQDDGYNRRPEYQPEDASRYGRRRVREGNFAQKWSTVYATHHGGIYQQINITPKSLVTLKAWAQAWSSSGDDAAVSSGGNYQFSVGIDPTGGTDWGSPNVVWSPRSNLLDQWVELSVQARAQGGTVTVYLRGDAEFRLKHNDAYFDEVCVTIVPPAPAATNTRRPTNTPAHTATPTNTLTPTSTLTPLASPVPSATPTPLPAVIRVLAFDDRNGDGVRDKEEALLAGAQIALANAQRTPLASHTTDGASEPYAFQVAEAGSYIVTEIDPPGYASTSPNQWTVAVLGGTQVELAFADRFAPTPTATFTPKPSATTKPTASPTALPLTRTPEPTKAPPTLGEIVSNMSGIIVAAVAILLLLALLLVRRRS